MCMCVYMCVCVCAQKIMQVFRSGIARLLLESLPSREKERTEGSDAKARRERRHLPARL